MINWQLDQDVTLPPVCKRAVIGSSHHMTLSGEWAEVDVWVGGKQKKTTQHDFIVMEVILSLLPRLYFNILSCLRSGWGIWLGSGEASHCSVTWIKWAWKIWLIHLDRNLSSWLFPETLYVKQIPKNLGKGPIWPLGSLCCWWSFSESRTSERVNCPFRAFSGIEQPDTTPFKNRIYCSAKREIKSIQIIMRVHDMYCLWVIIHVCVTWATLTTQPPSPGQLGHRPLQQASTTSS